MNNISTGKGKGTGKSHCNQKNIRLARKKNFEKYVELPVSIEKLPFYFISMSLLLQSLKTSKFPGLQPLSFFLLAKVKSDTDTVKF